MTPKSVTTRGLNAAANPTPTISVAAGDLIVAKMLGARFGSQTAITNTGQSLTWTLETSYATGDGPDVIFWSAVAGSTGDITVDFTAIDGVTRVGTVFVYENAEVGAAVTGAASGAPSLDITTQAANSGLLVGVWEDDETGSRTWRTVNSASPTESLYASNSPFGVGMGAYFTDAGAIGTKTVGLTAPSTFSDGAIGALEVKAVGGGGVTMTVDNTDLALTGQDVTLTATANVVLPVDFSLAQFSGQEITLTATANVTLTVDSSTVTFTGQEIPFQYINPADPGLLQFTGQDITLTATADVVLPVDTTTLQFSGQDVTLVAGNNITLTVENAVLTMSGSDVTLVADIDVTMPVDFSLLQFIGQDVGLLAGNSVTMVVDSGSLTLSGQDVGLAGTANVVMTITAPTLQFQGQNVQLDGGDPGITTPSSLRFISYGKEFPYTTYFAKLGWQPSSRSFGTSVAYYKLYRNGTYTGIQIPHPGETEEIYYFDKGLSKGTYTYRVAAMDSNGIETSQSNEVTVIITTTQDSGWLGGWRWKQRQRIR